MNCTDREDNLYLLAVDALEGAERVELQLHLGTGCPSCAGVLAGAVAVTGQLAVSMVSAGAGPSVQAKTTLDRRVAELAAEGDGVQQAERARLMIRPTVATGERERRRKYGWDQLALAACVAALLTAGPMFFYRHTENAFLRLAVVEKDVEVEKANERVQTAENQEKSSANRLASAEKSLADIQAVLTASQKQNSDLVAKNNELSLSLAAAQTDLAATQKVAEMLASKQLLMLDLKGMPGAPAGENAQARLLVDLQHKIWRLYTADLKPVPNKVFEFWLITADGTKVPMGSFKTDEKGQGTLTGDVPDPMPTLAMAAITDEPGPGAKVPTGTMHVVGKFQ